MALSAIVVKQAKATEKPQKLADGGGMYLLIQPTGAKLWRLDYRFDGKRKTLALGIYPDVSLSDARQATASEAWRAPRWAKWGIGAKCWKRCYPTPLRTRLKRPVCARPTLKSGG